jgi:CDP-diacylglycerol--glycerol-3-phosphate 3-phosphatidyltransferase/CDP-diacylglycerol--inositol 3-phosphatidyltransferase
VLDRFKGFWQNVMLAPFVRLFLKLGVSPDAVTVVGTLGVSAGALVFFPQGMLWQGVVFITAFVFSDLIDGQMARTMGRTDTFGAFLDSTLDRVADGAIFAGLALYFAWVAEDRVSLVLALVCLVMGAVTSYARARGEGLGYNAKTGIAERADRLVAILVMTFLSDVLDLAVLLDVVLWALAIASTVTVAQRVLLVRRQALAPVTPPDGDGPATVPGTPGSPG